jgi:hypothetical protein
MPNVVDYTRQLEDACLWFWQGLSSDQFIRLRKEAPALADFLAHIQHSIPHEEAVVRRNVWSS